MARYIDMDKLSKMIEAKADTLIEGKEAFLYIAKWLNLLPSADVVPKSDILPCKIGDEVYGVREFKHCKRIYKGKVTQMYFVGEEMKLAIVVNHIVRGEWGKAVFASREEAHERLRQV